MIRVIVVPTSDPMNARGKNSPPSQPAVSERFVATIFRRARHRKNVAGCVRASSGSRPTDSWPENRSMGTAARSRPSSADPMTTSQMGRCGWTKRSAIWLRVRLTNR